MRIAIPGESLTYRTRSKQTCFSSQPTERLTSLQDGRSASHEVRGVDDCRGCERQMSSRLPRPKDSGDLTATMDVMPELASLSPGGRANIANGIQPLGSSPHGTHRPAGRTKFAMCHSFVLPGELTWKTPIRAAKAPRYDRAPYRAKIQLCRFLTGAVLIRMHCFLTGAVLIRLERLYSFNRCKRRRRVGSA